MVDYDVFKSELTEGISDAVASFSYQLDEIYQNSTVEVSAGKVVEVAGQNLGSNLVAKYNAFLQNLLGVNEPTTMYGKQAIKQQMRDYLGINIDRIEKITGDKVPNKLGFDSMIGNSQKALNKAMSKNVQEQLQYAAGKDEDGFKAYVANTNAQYGLPTDFSGKTIDDVIVSFVENTLKAEEAAKNASE